MILRKRTEEILDLVKKTENEIACSDDVVVGDVYIGSGETDGMRLLARAAGSLKNFIPESITIFPAVMPPLSVNSWIKD